MVTTIIVSSELKPVILIPNNTLRDKILSVTSAIDKPNDKAILSTIPTRLKKTSVQANPGKKNTRMNPIVALRKDISSRKVRINCKICLITDSTSIFTTQNLQF
jgi:hypothetical protein